MSNKKNTDSNLQGVSRLITDATIGVTDIVEEMHNRVVNPPFLPSTPIQHLITKIAGLFYNNVRWTSKKIGGSLDTLLGALAHKIGDIKSSDQQEAIRSALNGVLGDYLQRTDNPLKIRMQFRHESKELQLNRKCLKAAFPSTQGKILVLVHGSSMTDYQWTQKNHNHGEAIAQELGKTLIYLKYNSGRHISSNGQDFSTLLEKLIKKWPVPVEEIIFVAHSMGGLVTRSALHYGQEQGLSWTKCLKKIIFLGTPHHGSPLEKTGNYFDLILETIHYTKPFAKLGKIRSAGVTDLRYGSLIDEDWKGIDRFKIQKDQREHIPLPEHIECFSIAASIGKQNTSQKTTTSRIPGDRLVDVRSALGQHKNPSKELHFKKENTWIAYESTHIDLLSSPQVYSKVKQWLL